MYKICKALNISISDLFGKFSNEKNKEDFPPKLQDILRLAENLNEIGQERLFEQAEFFYNKYEKK